MCSCVTTIKFFHLYLMHTYIPANTFNEHALFLNVGTLHTYQCTDVPYLMEIEHLNGRLDMQK